MRGRAGVGAAECRPPYFLAARTPILLVRCTKVNVGLGPRACKDRQAHREHIVRDALRLIDDEGLNAHTMRRLAARMDVGTMSLDNHVTNKAALHAGIVDAVLTQADVPPLASP